MILSLVSRSHLAREAGADSDRRVTAALARACPGVPTAAPIGHDMKPTGRIRD